MPPLTTRARSGSSRHSGTSRPTPWGHEDWVTDITFGIGARGRSILASAGSSGTVRLWDPETRATIGVPLARHQYDVTALASSPRESCLLASADSNGTLLVWNLADAGELVTELRAHGGSVTCLAFGQRSKGPPWLASGGIDGTVRLWRLGPTEPEVLHGHLGAVNSLAFLEPPHKPSTLLSAGSDGTVRIWEPLTGALVTVLRRRSTPRVLTVSTGSALVAIAEKSGLAILELDI